MKFLFIILLVMGSTVFGFAQKSLIDSNTYSKWPALQGQALMSNNGKFVTYSISVGLEQNQKITQVVQSTQNSWKLEFQGSIVGGNNHFTADNKYFISKKSLDSLIIVDLTSKTIKCIADVSEFTVPKSGFGDWFYYKKNGKESTAVLRNLRNGLEKSYQGGDLGQISENGRFFVLSRRSMDLDDYKQELLWLDLKTDKLISIWNGVKIENLVVDFNNQQLAFKSNDSLLYYKFGLSIPISLMSLNGVDSSRCLKVSYLNSFSKQGDRLYVTLRGERTIQLKTFKNLPEIWSYNDASLQGVQENRLQTQSESYLATIQIKDHKLVQLQKYNDERLLGDRNADQILSSFSLTGKEQAPGEDWWNSTSRKGYDLINSKTGERKNLNFIAKNIGNQDTKLTLSPNGEFIVYYDIYQNEYLSYEVKSGKCHILTKGIKTSWIVHNSNAFGGLRWIAGWLSNGNEVLIYDTYDIWKFDLVGKSKPKNVTNYLGHKYSTVFTLALAKEPLLIDKNKPLLLSAFNMETKYNGFFSKNINTPGDPLVLTMDPNLYVFYNMHFSGANSDGEFLPTKAKNAPVYLVKRQNANEATNYFVTNDFKSFTQLSHLSPQANYNWLTTELHKWKSLNGDDLQGILYKPENFDPNKRYPVIFYYYQCLSNGINRFLQPSFSHGAVDIPTYVSNGYLVFCPDVYYRKGDPMQGTYNSVVSAAHYLSSMPYVNKNKLGIQGQSFGAIQTNYLVTHTDLFAAACSSSGLGDWISGYGGVYSNGASFMSMYEYNGQNRMGNLWMDLAGYIKNSPVLQTHKVVTPIFLMHTKLDAACPFPNVLEFFLGLRRLGKKAWMVVYPEENHALYGKEEMSDFTLRMQQFFDHYLKNKPAPIWMLDGVSAKSRSFGAGTQLDTTGRMPGAGLLTGEKQREVDSLMIRKAITITLK